MDFRSIPKDVVWCNIIPFVNPLMMRADRNKSDECKTAYNMHKDLLMRYSGVWRCIVEDDDDSYASFYLSKYHGSYPALGPLLLNAPKVMMLLSNDDSAIKFYSTIIVKNLVEWYAKAIINDIFKYHIFYPSMRFNGLISNMVIDMKLSTCKSLKDRYEDIIIFLLDITSLRIQVDMKSFLVKMEDLCMDMDIKYPHRDISLLIELVQSYQSRWIPSSIDNNHS